MTSIDTARSDFPDEQADDGSFKRKDSLFRDWVRADGSSGFPAEAGRYHLYVSLACPWAHRTLIVRQPEGPRGRRSRCTIVDPIRDERGWAFTDEPGTIPIRSTASRFLSEVYVATEPAFDGRVTVPVLWDKQTGAIVNNESPEIIRMLDLAFDGVRRHAASTSTPRTLRAEIDALNAVVYDERQQRRLQGRLRAARRRPTRRPFDALFATLDQLEARLGDAAATSSATGSPRPTGGSSPTLVRFDAVYVRPLQVQPAADRRLPEPLGLRCATSTSARRRRDGRLRPHQAPLLRDAPARSTRRASCPSGPRSTWRRRTAATTCASAGERRRL